jgi:hypothetical protein
MTCIELVRKNRMFNIAVPPGKPLITQFWNLRISVSTGFLANIDETGTVDHSVWIDINDHTQYSNHIGAIELTHHGITFELLLNDKILYRGGAEDIVDLTLSHPIETTETPVDCTLSFKISGFQAHHMPLITNSVSARPAIRIKSIEFENVDITKIFINDSTFVFDNGESTGDTVFGCNGTSTYNFYTPIYAWLLKNKQQLISNTL